MKLAIIQDQLLTPAGTERVFLYMVEEFSDADIFTLAYNKNTTWNEYKNYKINTSILNPIIRNHKLFKYLFPISTIVMENWDLSKYDRRALFRRVLYTVQGVTTVQVDRLARLAATSH